MKSPLLHSPCSQVAASSSTPCSDLHTIHCLQCPPHHPLLPSLRLKFVHTQILLIRSLYSYVRVLPAYRMYRACKRHGGELFNTSYTLSTTADPSLQLLQHTHTWGGPQGSSSSSSTGNNNNNNSHQQQQRQQGAGAAGGSGRMCQFAFTPVETLGGSFSIHVEYQPATTVHILEVGEEAAARQDEQQ